MNAIDTINIGDIFVSSWGYDQTNVDFYKVTRKTKAMIELSPIPGKIEQKPGYSDMAGFIKPDLSAEPGAPIGLKKPSRYAFGGEVHTSVKIESFATAKKIDNPETYSTYVSWYA